MPHFSAAILDEDPAGAALLRALLGPAPAGRCTACIPAPLFGAAPPVAAAPPGAGPERARDERARATGRRPRHAGPASRPAATGRLRAGSRRPA
ncbi:hypothetical protein OPKNFCMD_5013 [Methylobacterium crusticola]|uniref:Uncharacterized protein n=1 Tax=Methylobacterium crusticola TaxID=1697972 RepID=A0ABQ4R536_9HYPH|nr:hypothetical protein [Methylobacterium crusticola]GJD52250.1 hypothetical protein OPKNFCMD_5013 [Methylobacterium crusticola]